MNLRILLLIAIFRLLNSAMAVWDPKTPLVLLETQDHLQVFPLVVQWSDADQCKVYYHFGQENPKIHAYCPKPGDINRYCNYETFDTNATVNEQRPAKRCPSKVFYELTKVKSQQGQHIECETATERKGHLYRFVYRLCDENGIMGEILVYEACYDKNEKLLIYASYTIQTPSLLGNPRLAEDRSATFNFNPFHYKHEEFFDHFEEVTYLYKQNQEYQETLVLPYELLSWGLLRKTLFHYVNLAPMLSDLKEGWNLMMKNLAAKLSAMRQTTIHVSAGLIDFVYDKVDNRLSKRYLGKVNNVGQIGIPRTWWVMLYNQNKTKGVVILMHNTLYNVEDPTFLHLNNHFCGLQYCDRVHLTNVLPSKTDYPNNYIYCCHPNAITEIIPLNGHLGLGLMKFPKT